MSLDLRRDIRKCVEELQSYAKATRQGVTEWLSGACLVVTGYIDSIGAEKVFVKEYKQPGSSDAEEASSQGMQHRNWPSWATRRLGPCHRRHQPRNSFGRTSRRIREVHCRSLAAGTQECLGISNGLGFASGSRCQRPQGCLNSDDSHGFLSVAGLYKASQGH